ncbi:hypothetical protein L4174_018390 [Photobacterium sp. CCB-ST2H9]|uniref:hypothetical protein n=1 Tax=Photobacterium sp. CCB-ST2H9 TaxID=2912855 RepID=UPI0020069D06|nr:hypothetical protein [Photobacterium sp. CCB-ST2H9]UTM60031.1 hypothetical protein L4174_018390 [Photobacterium sp. CCB-ST2H9]
MAVEIVNGAIPIIRRLIAVFGLVGICVGPIKCWHECRQNEMDLSRFAIYASPFNQYEKLILWIIAFINPVMSVFPFLFSDLVLFTFFISFLYPKKNLNSYAITNYKTQNFISFCGSRNFPEQKPIKGFDNE